MSVNSVQMFGDNRTRLISFKMFPILTNYKDVGLRNFTMAGDIERKLQLSSEIATENNTVTLGDIVSNDLNMVTLENNANGVLDIDGGVSATRYQFTLVVDETKMSGNIERIFIRGYTSAIDLNQRNSGMFSRAVPNDTLFYIDSYTSVVYSRKLNGNGYIATNNTNSDNILSNESISGSIKTTIRPKDVVTSNYINESSNGVGVNNGTNVLTTKTNVLSNISNNNVNCFTKTILNGFMHAVSEEFDGHGYSNDGISDKSSILKSTVTNCIERSITDVPVLQRLFSELRRHKISILTVDEIKRILNTHTLDGLIEIIEHTDFDINSSLVGLSDVNLLGSDTITVGVHDLYNNIQPIISDSGLSDINLVCIANHYDMMEPFDVRFVNYNSFYDEETMVRKLNIFRSNIVKLCLSSFDKYLRFDEEVIKYGGYALQIDYKFFVDTTITLSIGNEEMKFRFPNFAGSQFTPVVSNDPRNMNIVGISNAVEGFSNDVLSKAFVIA